VHRGIWAISRDSRSNSAEFLCDPDCMAEDPVVSRTFLWQIPCNREKYREIEAISAGTVAMEFAQTSVPEPPFSLSAPV
jgi:hypothetical protein